MRDEATTPDGDAQEPRLVSVDPEAPDARVLARAGAILRAGGLVAFPTETVYGLGAHALDAAAVRRIYEAKGRPDYNPLIVHVADTDAAGRVAREVPERARLAARAFWPGPLTLVLPKRDGVPDIVTAGLDSVAVRVPAHPVALALLRASGLPIAAPSANRFTELSPTTAAHVVKGLGDRVDLVLDGGPTSVGIESTVVDLTGERPVLLRPGLVSREALERVLGPVALPAEVPEGEAPRASPGMIERHYAPRAELRLVTGDARALLALAVTLEAQGHRVGVVALGGAGASEAADTLPPGRWRALPDDPAGFAREVYATLHDFDDLGLDLVLVQEVPAGDAWAGVRDRLQRASHGG